MVGCSSWRRVVTAAAILPALALGGAGRAAHAERDRGRRGRAYADRRWPPRARPHPLSDRRVGEPTAPPRPGLRDAGPEERRGVVGASSASSRARRPAACRSCSPPGHRGLGRPRPILAGPGRAGRCGAGPPPAHRRGRPRRQPAGQDRDHRRRRPPGPVRLTHGEAVRRQRDRPRPRSRLPADRPRRWDPRATHHSPLGAGGDPRSRARPPVLGAQRRHRGRLFPVRRHLGDALDAVRTGSSRSRRRTRSRSCSPSSASPRGPSAASARRARSSTS